MTGGIRCALMRGGTSKGAMLLADDLPADEGARNDLLLRIMGSPDPRQVDGLGGAHPLTSKVCVLSASAADDVDVDYLFLQVVVDQPVVATSQTCGNMLAAVGPFAIERGLVEARSDVTDVRVRLLNTEGRATLRVRTPHGVVAYDGEAEVAGVPGTASPVEIVAGQSVAPLLPTGLVRDRLAGHEVTCVDNGMPSVLVRATDLGYVGDEEPSVLEADVRLRQEVHAIRAAAAEAMGLSADLGATTVPKIVLVSAPRNGGTLTTRSFIPERVHQAIGVLGAASVAAAARLPGSVGADVAELPGDPGATLRIEHPTGFLDVRVVPSDDPQQPVASTSVVRTARMIMDGTVHPAPPRDRASHTRPASFVAHQEA